MKRVSTVLVLVACSKAFNGEAEIGSTANDKCPEKIARRNRNGERAKVKVRQYAPDQSGIYNGGKMRRETSRNE